jgi:hypothetical protein
MEADPAPAAAPPGLVGARSSPSRRRALSPRARCRCQTHRQTSPPEHLTTPPTPSPHQQVSLGGAADATLAACANSSSPICFNTTVTGTSLLTSLAFNAVLGAICLLGFVAARGRFRFYQARLYAPSVTHKPPAMALSGGSGFGGV